MRTCSVCKKDQPDDQFKIKRNGKINKSCITCIDKMLQRYEEKKPALQKYQRERYHQPDKRRALLDYQKDWFNKNPGYVTSYIKERRKTDAAFDVRMSAQDAIYQAISKKYADIFLPELGCTGSQFRTYIESLFKEGMTWENHGRGGWNFDHKFPLSVAMKAGMPVLEKALNYRNVQPIWEVDNYDKFFDLPPEWPTVEAFMAAF